MLYAIFLLLSSRAGFQSWKDWRIILFIFYIIDILTTVLLAGFDAFSFVIPEIYNKRFNTLIVFGIIVEIASIIAIWLIISSYSYYNRLFVDAEGAPLPFNSTEESLNEHLEKEKAQLK